ncbi:DUF2637 domain-containing protein [Actinocorallia libanotica]|uniref:DUF2637 domain-containing protein n=1 Tax=Actinocorallia libanotica TaxID=46162 RepID=A0ABN1Q3D1_9ACTN
MSRARRLGRSVVHLVMDSGPVVVLAIIAAAGSFSHIRNLAERQGQEGWKAWAVAVCIDLLCVMAARERHRDAVIGRTSRGWVSWPVVVLAGGVILTLAANLAEARPGWWAHILSAVPAAAFLIAVSMLERRAGYRPEPAADLPDPEPVQVGPEPSRTEVVREDPVAGPSVPALAPAAEPVPELPAVPARPASPPPAAKDGPAPALLDLARQVADQHQAKTGKPITRDQLKARLRVGTDLATTLHRTIRTAS